MASAFSITTGTNNIPIGKQRSTTTVTFTVTNTSGQPVTGRALLVMDPPYEEQAAWLQLPPPQKSERDFDVNGVQNYSVEVKVPVKAVGGDYLFHLDMSDTENPDEIYTVGPAVKLLVAEPDKKPFPWWIVAVAVGVLAVIIGAVIFWPRGIEVPNVIGRPVTVAQETITAAGLAFLPTAEINSEKPAGIVLTTIPGAGEQVRKATPVFYVRSLGQEPTITFTPTPTFTPTVTFTPTPPLSGKIAFVSIRDGNGEIYVMNADGSNQMRLTINNAVDGQPSVSPDRSKIAFDTGRDGNEEIYVMNADGSNQINLTQNNADDFSADWSQDGSKIAFASNRDGDHEIYVMNADGSNQINLTNNEAFDFFPDDQVPTWSPDGSKIAFVSYRDGTWEIYVMNADGSNQRRLTDNTAVDWDPAWSPDGSKIAFFSNMDGDNEIYVISADGGSPIRLTNNNADDSGPAWSPDGGQIVFSSNRDGNFEIYVMNADGGLPIRLTTNTPDDIEPAW